MLNFIPKSSTSSTLLQQCKGMGNGGCSQFLSLCLCRSFLLTLFPCSCLGSLPWDTIFRELLQCGSFPRAAVLHKLLQHQSFPQGAVCQEWSAPAWVPCGVIGPARRPGPAWTLLCGATSPATSLLQRRLSMGSQPASGIHLLWHGVCPGLQVEICSTVDLHQLRGNSLLHHDLSALWAAGGPLLWCLEHLILLPLH